MTPLIATHAFAALVSLILGGWQLFLSEKGSPAHRFVGWIWVAAMYFVAVSSFWITEIREGHFSLLHVLSVVTIVTVPLGIVGAIRGDIRSHLGNMTGNYIGLSFAFLFAMVIPQRHIPQLVMTEPIDAAMGATAVIVTSLTLVWMGGRVQDCTTWARNSRSAIFAKQSADSN
ncbi:MAG TPA: DUF2306 domain-containing protein [Aeromicrobium sp.]|nr:DUF2306 domain-containing protein [Aeromicrobium sp.]